MITAENGHLLIKGDKSEVITEYSAITGRMLQDVFSTNRFGALGKDLPPESRAAAGLVANLVGALLNHTNLDRKEFLDAMKRIIEYERKRQ